MPVLKEKWRDREGKWSRLNNEGNISQVFEAPKSIWEVNDGKDKKQQIKSSEHSSCKKCMAKVENNNNNRMTICA